MPRKNDPNRLTIKQKKFVANKVAGKKNAEAYVQAGYKATTRNVAEVEGSRLTNKPNIQAAIDKALEFHGATPEFAVGVLKQVADQEDEIGAKRLAAKDILELHGWRKDERPQMSLNIKQAFFTESRGKVQEHNQGYQPDGSAVPIDGEIVEQE